MLFSRHTAIAVFALIALPFSGKAANVPPQTTAPIPDATLYKGAPADVVDLTKYFTDPDTTEVRLTTVLGDIDLALYPEATPITVANFLKYVDSGRYEITDPTTGQLAPLFFHRSVPGFVLQSGGYLNTVSPTDPPNPKPTQVVAYPAIKNEPGISNKRGTIAMAKLANMPDSATSEWFINLADNGGSPNNLDTADGGYTVFGRVVNGMDVVDAIAALKTYNFGGAFSDLPLRNFSLSQMVMLSNFITIPSITRIPALTFTATSNNPSIASVAISSGNLLVTPKGIGTAQITVTGTDVDGASVSESFSVTMVSYPPHLANISTRVVVGGAQNSLIGGFIVGDSTKAKRLAIRALGPSLGNPPFNLPNVLADPTLELHNSKGDVIATNDNWQDSPQKQAIIDAKLAPKNANESVILTTLPASQDGTPYTAVVQGSNGSSGIGVVEVYDLDSGPGSSLLNISTRGNVQAGTNNVMIGGLIVSGNSSQRVLLRAIGPSLSAYGISNPLSDPTLTLRDSQGNQVAFNDNWQDGRDQGAAIKATKLQPTDPRESAILETLSVGAYTAIVSGKNGVTGTGLVEAYTLPPLTP